MKNKTDQLEQFIQPKRKPPRKQKEYPPDLLRVCQICHKLLPLSEFGKVKSQPGGRAYKCRACERVRVSVLSWGKLTVEELEQSIARDREVLQRKEAYLKERKEALL